MEQHPGEKRETMSAWLPYVDLGCVAMEGMLLVEGWGALDRFAAYARWHMLTVCAERGT